MPISMGGFRDAEELEEASARYRVDVNAAIDKYSAQITQFKARVQSDIKDWRETLELEEDTNRAFLSNPHWDDEQIRILEEQYASKT